MRSHGYLERAQLGEFKPGCMIVVYGEDGESPHFHIEYKDLKKYCCISIDNASYYNHENDTGDCLSDSELAELVQWLRSDSKEFSMINVKLSNYQNICILWNQNNKQKVQVPLTGMPEYSVGLHICKHRNETA